MGSAFEEKLNEYMGIVSRNETLKSEERVLNVMLSNLKQLRDLLIDKERIFCDEDARLRSAAVKTGASAATTTTTTSDFWGSNDYSATAAATTTTNDDDNNDHDLKSCVRQRTVNTIDHLVHFKCIIECMATDILNLESNIISDDEYVSLSLAYRQVELEILQAIRRNQQRIELFAGLKEEALAACLPEIEFNWRREHEHKRKLMNNLLLDHSDFVVDKTRRNLDEQQSLLNHRYQFINNLIKLS